MFSFNSHHSQMREKPFIKSTRRKKVAITQVKALGQKQWFWLNFSKKIHSLQLCLASLNPKWNFRGDVICPWKVGLLWKCWQALQKKIVVSWAPVMSLMYKWQYLYTETLNVSRYGYSLKIIVLFIMFNVHCLPLSYYQDIIYMVFQLFK